MVYNKRGHDVIGEYDVIVAGAGPAGICAAVSSARMGLKTALVERYGIVGGNLTSGFVGPVMGQVGKGTIVSEMQDLLNIIKPYGRVSHDIEHAKIVLPDWIKSAGVKTFLQTPVVDTIMDKNRICGLVVGTKNGLKEMRAKVVIDATGDGVVSYLAGAEIGYGRDSDGLVQPVTLMFLVSGVDDSIAISHGNHTYDVRMPGSNFRQKCRDDCERGLLPKNASFVRLYRTNRPNECMVNTTQENYVNGLDIDDMERAEINLRGQINVVRDYLRSNVRGFENCYVSGSSNTLGIRETRRVMGEYVLTEQDVINGHEFEDAVVSKAEFIVDIHNPTGAEQDDERSVKPYDIPYRSLVPRNIDGLLTAGRCISGSHHAHGSYRVMYICMAMGQAAGVAAALSAKNAITPRELDYKALRIELEKLGVELSNTKKQMSK